jgi:electron transfer flavoprotein beta subunit
MKHNSMCKTVPDPEKYDLLRIDPKTKSLVREGVPTIVNPADKNALELALELKAQHGGKVAVVSMCPLFSQTNKSLPCHGGRTRDISKVTGLSEAPIRIQPPNPGKGDRETGFKPDLILNGTESADGATSQVLPSLENGSGFRILQISQMWKSTAGRPE